MRFVGIDPSTKTGFVALDEQGKVLRAKEITGAGSKDPYRMRTMIEDLMCHIHPCDLICIEGFGYASQQAIQNGGIGWGIRMALDKLGIDYKDIAPNTVKSFVGVTGWTGEKGSKVRLQGKAKKDAVAVAVEEMFGYIHPSDNVIDAYVLARIALHQYRESVKKYKLRLLNKK
ncbi:hypothetical protein NW801_13465 [Brevibacillus laterosporus]|uniref:Uncharacterized protein n=1 Tax=Brevibacillus halotolerans TaxID=1507437 RepID=A0ABT4HZL8_9BACL|nr:MULTISPECIES: hypothetical protein [Brevibacillus]MCR8986031.1 hypothetical protein [Brevibacillus laterosporus]MCZ0831764.1 hypothetical protein [Brevibacillus halotolerans]GIO03444.1 hypothetical protein J5TS2_41120 [Brevibacillus halotolerans]